MAITNRQLTRRTQKFLRQDKLLPTTWPKIINPHVFNPSTAEGTKTCLECGQIRNNKLHISAHSFTRNFDSKRGHCMCGLRPDHYIHGGVN